MSHTHTQTHTHTHTHTYTHSVCKCMHTHACTFLAWPVDKVARSGQVKSTFFPVLACMM